jgi:hypothetical protein
MTNDDNDAAQFSTEQSPGQPGQARRVLEEIASAGSWLPITTVRAAFCIREALTPIFLDIVRQRAAAAHPTDIRQHRLAAFGVFYLAQHREPELFEPLVRLMETCSADAHDEWLFSDRIFFFGHRLLAGVSPLAPQRPISLVMNPNLRPLTRSTALPAIGLLAALGDISRSEAVRHMRSLFGEVKAARIPELDSNWVRTAIKIHCRELQRELQWFLASGRLERDSRPLIADAMRQHPDDLFLSILELESAVDVFRNVFPQDVRDGEVGLLPNSMIPGLHEFLERGPGPGAN